MFARLGWLLFWLVMGATGAGILVMEWRHPPRLQTSIAVDTPPAVTVPPLQPFEPLPLTHYAEIVERPVFIDTRRPEEDELTAPTAPPEPDQPLDLIGVLLVPGAATALLRPTEPNAKVLRVAQGEMVEGWRLQSVSANRVVLQKNGEIRELVLIRPPPPTHSTTAPGRIVSPSGQPPVLTPGPRPAPGS